VLVKREAQQRLLSSNRKESKAAQRMTSARVGWISECADFGSGYLAGDP
jgi:hypothetical protein